MYVSELKQKEIDKLKGYNGEKSVNELMELLEIENKSSENLRTFLDRLEIPYKLERKSYTPRRRESILLEVKQQKGLKLKLGESYYIEDNSHTREEPIIYKGRIVKEYPRYYLGESISGYCFTVHKMPREYTVRQLKKEKVNPPL